jgi:hypothetical protein
MWGNEMDAGRRRGQRVYGVLELWHPPELSILDSGKERLDVSTDSEVWSWLKKALDFYFDVLFLTDEAREEQVREGKNHYTKHPALTKTQPGHPTKDRHEEGDGHAWLAATRAAAVCYLKIARPSALKAKKGVARAQAPSHPMAQESAFADDDWLPDAAGGSESWLAAAAAGKLALETEVEAEFGGEAGNWHRGRVALVNVDGSVAVDYDDGDFEASVAPAHLRPPADTALSRQLSSQMKSVEGKRGVKRVERFEAGPASSSAKPKPKPKRKKPPAPPKDAARLEATDAGKVPELQQQVLKLKGTVSQLRKSEATAAAAAAAAEDRARQLEVELRVRSHRRFRNRDARF